ncbi:glycoside hydrolase family 3 N-terminal domain-containing protein [Bifidobacterium psychraerophilum]|uniref:glycoside hydrolase family 3 N-terminal domain-containing protein n=1 Tax=Bifidobacterium psychraerophilum TaxID=218140 RepID=UPI0039EB91CF
MRRTSLGIIHSSAIRGVAFLLVLCCIIALAACSPLVDQHGKPSNTSPAVQHSQSFADREAAPSPNASIEQSPEYQAASAVAAMSLEERVGQLVMAPLNVGDDPEGFSTLIARYHVGSVLLLGNWRGGVAQVGQAAQRLQGYAPAGSKLLIASDQEGGQVQHLRGPGFDSMPSGVEQGRMDTASLRSSAGRWGTQLKSAGVNVNLAPVLDTVQTQPRQSNAPVGALDRDFGLDAGGNSEHGIAFIQGMADAGVSTAIKHYPGLGAVTGNTDFTAQGIADSTTSFDGDEISAFTAALKADPAMVMMSLATYSRLDPGNPAAFSATIIGNLRNEHAFNGVITSDSLSAAALGGTSPDQLGVRFVEAGGDLACIGARSYVEPVIQGLIDRAKQDPAFASKIQSSATRVMTLKYSAGLAQ